MLHSVHNAVDAHRTVLAADGVCKHFDGVRALTDVSFELHTGEIHALMGENGAGKSTLGKILAGVFRMDAGSIRLDGQAFDPTNPQHAQSAGIAMIFQELDLFPELSVAENMAIANHACVEGGWVRQSRLEAFCRPFLDQVGLSVPTSRKVGDLPISHQQLVAIARALSMRARILVMDESTSALPEEDVTNLFAVMTRLKDQGVSIIYVSHRMDEIFRICDRVTVLRDGEYVGTRGVAETSMDELIRMMVGRSVDRQLRNRSHCGEATLLHVEKLRTPALTDISFSLRRGEVIGLAGLVGAGRTELGRALFGMDRKTGGSVTLAGEPFQPRGPRQAMYASLGFAPEDRKTMGLMRQMGVRENMTLATLFSQHRLGFVRRSAERAAYEAMKSDTRLKTASATHPISSLSGGNQQKVLLGRWLMLAPQVLFLDDPTRGVDIGAKEDIYALIERIASEQKGVLMVSSELPELLRCCDRILVLNEGRITADLKTDQTSQEQIMHFAATPLGQLEPVE